MKRKCLKMLCLLLVLGLLAGCNRAPSEETTTAAAEDFTIPTGPLTFEEVKNPANFVSISLTIGDSFRSLTAYPDENGMTYVEFVGDVKKVGTMDPIVIHGITKAVEESGLAVLNGINDYAEGMNFASAYVSYTDETFLGLSYSGVVAEAYLAAYEKLENYFERLTADLSVYVPRPIVMGEVSEPELTAITEILDHSGIGMLDSFTISAVVKDETFAYAAGLSDDTHVLSGAACGALMMTTPYSLVVVRADSEENIDAIRADFAANLSWNKWVCVSATNAVIAQKGDLVLCLMGTGYDYEATLQGIENTGWEKLEHHTAN